MIYIHNNAVYYNLFFTYKAYKITMVTQKEYTFKKNQLKQNPKKIIAVNTTVILRVIIQTNGIITGSNQGYASYK